MRMDTYAARLQALPSPSPELQVYTQAVLSYITAGGAQMSASDEVWLEFCEREQQAWDAVPEADRTRARACAQSL